MKDVKLKRQEIMQNITSLYELIFPFDVEDSGFYDIAEEMLIKLALTIHGNKDSNAASSEESIHNSFITKVEFVIETY